MNRYAVLVISPRTGDVADRHSIDLGGANACADFYMESGLHIVAMLGGPLGQGLPGHELRRVIAEHMPLKLTKAHKRIIRHLRGGGALQTRHTQNTTWAYLIDPQLGEIKGLRFRQETWQPLWVHKYIARLNPPGLFGLGWRGKRSNWDEV